MDLYTPLTRLKMEMNRGRLPPMTPLSEPAKRLFDPAFTIGMGALTADPERGLRCPYRRCGKWYHNLSKHLGCSHAAVGGRDAVYRLLSIPRSASLVSKSFSETRAAQAKRQGPPRNWGVQQKILLSGPVRQRAIRTRQRSSETIGVRNFKKACSVQLQHAFLDLYSKLRRSPNCVEFYAEYPGLQYWLLKVYGSWSNAVSHFGFVPRRRGEPARGTRSRNGLLLDSSALLASLEVWYEKYGDLPSSTKTSNRAPLLHANETYLKAFKTESWPEAMRRAAALLNIYGGKYGLPIEHKPKEEAAA